ncbi:hypothetical protein [Tunturiibacter lichenicola]|uniref:hypothetical protein n=1 Tax=Tunturiibacter lichenicola TaxID=2051959 RepID=UPI0021B1A221|nr:hypothetical protein [Edaphobacter lichenicola]
MKKPAQHLIAEVPRKRSKAGLTIRRKESFAATFFQFRFHEGPEFGTSVLDLWADSFDDALISHTVLQPAPP